MANIEDFKARMIGDGARSNQFRVELSFPTYVELGVDAGEKAQFLCKSTSLPVMVMENVGVKYRGMTANFAASGRAYQPWRVTIYNDSNMLIRTAMEQWQHGIQNLDNSTGLVAPAQYQVNLTVRQLDKNDRIIKTYDLISAYPTNIGEIALDYDTDNTISTFDVEFVYDYFLASGVNL